MAHLMRLQWHVLNIYIACDKRQVRFNDDDYDGYDNNDNNDS